LDCYKYYKKCFLFYALALHCSGAFFYLQEANMAKPSHTQIQPVSFTDKAFRSRMNMLDDGRSFVVINRAC
jgi:hypothetical protein